LCNFDFAGDAAAFPDNALAESSSTIQRYFEREADALGSAGMA
jgi:hypothetical protein